MKRCPSCGELYDDQQKFCELDGSPLMTEPTQANIDNTSVSPPERGAPPPPSQPQTSRTLIIGLALGIITCLAVIGLYRTLTWESGRNTATTQPAGNVSVTPGGPASAARTEPAAIPTPTPSAEATPTVEGTPTPAPSPIPAAPTQQPPDDGLAALSDAPAATVGVGAHASKPVRLRLTDGAVIEADEAWRAREGIWYRRGSILTLLDRARVRSVERLPAPTPSPPTP